MKINWQSRLNTCDLPNEPVAAFDRLLEPIIGSVRASDRQLDGCTGKETKPATGTDVLTIRFLRYIFAAIKNYKYFIFIA